MSVTEKVGPGRPSGRPNGRPTAGVDWASEEHAVSVVGPDGVELERFTVEHTSAGMCRLLSRLQRAGVAEVGGAGVGGSDAEVVHPAGAA